MIVEVSEGDRSSTTSHCFMFPKGFEVTVIAVGWIGEVELAAHTIAFNTLGIFYMIPLALSVGLLTPSSS